MLAKDLRSDRQFRAEWKKSAFARAVALRVLQYRVGHGLSQARLATKLGMKQSAIARLELGEVTPSFDTLVRLAEGLDIEVVIDINPGRGRSKLVTQVAERTGVKTSTRDGSRVLVAAASCRPELRCAHVPDMHAQAGATLRAGRPRRHVRGAGERMPSCGQVEGRESPSAEEGRAKSGAGGRSCAWHSERREIPNGS